MDQQPIRITVDGIKKALKSYNVERAISEYIWNGYDAGATEIFLEFDDNGIEGISEIRIIDNGTGIQYEDLPRTFRPFFQSDKDFQDAAKKKISAIHGKNDVGRLTFFQFARYANWETIYSKFASDEQQNYIYSIDIGADTLNEFSTTVPEPVESETATMVRFTGISANINLFQFETNIFVFLVKQFAWFLELNKARGCNLFINGQPLDYSEIIGDSEDTIHQIHEDNQTFEFKIRYVRWTDRLINEYSHYYYIGSDNIERQKETTTLNNKGDSFYHSVYITSDYFDMIDVYLLLSSRSEDNQLTLPTLTRTDQVYKELREFVDNFLRTKRKPFLRQYTDRLIQEYEQDGVFPTFGTNQWDAYRYRELEELVRELYQVEPKLFTQLNFEQKKTFVHLLNLALDEGERGHLFEVLREVVDLDPSELVDLAQLLKRSRLSNIIKTIRLIEDRFRAIGELRELVFNHNLYVNEPKHIQKMIESHYWILGEEYHLVTAAEPKFEEALRRYIYHLRGEKKDVSINHKDKKREMDIFAVRWSKRTDTINNIVVELKNPKVNLGEEQLRQVKKYMSVIQEQQEFNAENMTWQFYLIGNKYDRTKYIEQEKENSKQHGEQSLVFAVDGKKYRIYVKTWSEIFTEFELRHNFLLEKLQVERDELVQDVTDADVIVTSQSSNTATRPSEIILPEND